MIRSPLNILCKAHVENMQPEQNENASAKKQPHIKRPLNAYMLWSQNRRQEIALVYPKLRHSEISKQMGVEWNQLTKEQKQPFIDEAKRLSEQYMRDHSEYKWESIHGNAMPFNLWSRDRRREIFSATTNALCPEMDKQLAAKWKMVTIEEKQPFIDKAKRLIEQRMRYHEYKCSPRHKLKSIKRTLCTENPNQEDFPYQHKFNYFENNDSRQELNECDSVYSNASTSSLIQQKCPEPQYYNEESPLDLSVKKVRQHLFTV